MRYTPGWTRSSRASGRGRRLRLTVGVDPRDELAEDAVRVLVRNLAGARGLVATTAVLEHERADVRARRAVHDRLAGGEDGVLLLQPPQRVDRDVLLAEDRVDHEAVGGVDDLLLAEVEHHEVLVHVGAALDLLDRGVLVRAVELDALAHVRRRE